MFLVGGKAQVELELCVCSGPSATSEKPRKAFIESKEPQSSAEKRMGSVEVAWDVKC